MIQIGDERSNGSLKVDVVFPKRVVSIEQQCLSGRESGNEAHHTFRVAKIDLDTVTGEPWFSDRRLLYIRGRAETSGKESDIGLRERKPREGCPLVESPHCGIHAALDGSIRRHRAITDVR